MGPDKPAASNGRSEAAGHPASDANAEADRRNVRGHHRDGAADPLMTLRAIFMEIEWEITENGMTAFIEQIGRLKERYKADQIVGLFLQLLASIGKYIRRYKAASAPEAIKLLNSVYQHLEQIFQSPDLTEVQKKKILMVEVDKFNRLKQDILRHRKAAPDDAEGAPDHLKEHMSVPTQDQSALQEVLVQGLSEIKTMIRDEFELLRADLKNRGSNG